LCVIAALTTSTSLLFIRTNNEAKQQATLQQQTDDIINYGSNANRQWQLFLTQSAQEWQGGWSRIDPNFTLIETYLGNRTFTPTSDRRSVTQMNYYRWTNGSTSINGPWFYNITYSGQDGLYFSGPRGQEDLTRIVSNPAGITFFGFPNFNSAPPQFFFELFLPDYPVRTSLTSLYMSNTLLRLSWIKEDVRGWPSPDWSTSFDVDPQRPIPPAGFKGKITVIYAATTEVDIPIDFTWQGFESPDSIVFKLSDNITIAVPPVVVPGQNGTIWEIVWQKTLNTLVYGRVEFDENGDFTKLIRGDLTL